MIIKLDSTLTFNRGSQAVEIRFFANLMPNFGKFNALMEHHAILPFTYFATGYFTFAASKIVLNTPV